MQAPPTSPASGSAPPRGQHRIHQPGQQPPSGSVHRGAGRDQMITEELRAFLVVPGIDPRRAGGQEEEDAGVILISHYWDGILVATLGTLLGVHIRTPLPALAAARLRELRWHAIAWAVGVSLIVDLQLWVFIEGVYILRTEKPPEPCSLMTYWLISYCLALLVMPCLVGCALPLASLLILAGITVREHVPLYCKKEAHSCWVFIDTASARGAMTLALASLASVIVLLARQRLEDFGERYGTEGVTHQDVLRKILAGPAPELAGDAECSICLGGTDGGLLTSWCSLSCGHVFHEACLLEWLGRSRRCPLCRLDLHAAYLDS